MTNGIDWKPEASLNDQWLTPNTKRETRNSEPLNLKARGNTRQIQAESAKNTLSGAPDFPGFQIFSGVKGRGIVAWGAGGPV